MLRRVCVLAVCGMLAGVPAVAAELITYPKLVRGTLAFAPAPLATLNLDWLGAFAPEAKQPPTISDLQEFLSGTPVGGEMYALIGLAELTEPTSPPATLRHDDWPGRLDF